MLFITDYISEDDIIYNDIGRVLLMIEINKEIQDVIRDIIAQEEAEAAQEIRISEAKAEVSIAT